MRYMLAFLALGLAGCKAVSTSTAYVPTAAPASVCAPAPAAVQYRVVPMAVAPRAAAPCAPAAGECANGACAAPNAYAGGYMVTDTRYVLNDQAASAINIVPDLFFCGAGFVRCVWTRILDPILPPANASGTYTMSGR